MRDRRHLDWVHDLSSRHELEQTVAKAIDIHPKLQLLETNTNRFDLLDYTVSTRRVPKAQIELKAKWQQYRGWHRYRPDVPEPDLFILDELALRRIVAEAPHSQLAIHDHPSNRWVVFGVSDLVLAPKARVARRLNRSRPTIKGKVLVDLTDGHETGSNLTATIDYLATAIDGTDHLWPRVEPWPHFHTGEAS